jgi:hypothetical protein
MGQSPSRRLQSEDNTFSGIESPGECCRFLQQACIASGSRSEQLCPCAGSLLNQDRSISPRPRTPTTPTSLVSALLSTEQVGMPQLLRTISTRCELQSAAFPFRGADAVRRCIAEDVYATTCSCSASCRCGVHPSYSCSTAPCTAAQEHSSDPWVVQASLLQFSGH